MVNLSPGTLAIVHDANVWAPGGIDSLRGEIDEVTLCCVLSLPRRYESCGDHEWVLVITVTGLVGDVEASELSRA